MEEKVIYHQQVSYCGKARCRKCREGTGHGPYWYSYQTMNGRTTRRYVGKELPSEVRERMEGVQEGSLAHGSEERKQSLIRVYALGQQLRLERRAGRAGSEWQTVIDPAWQHQRVRSLLTCLLSVTGRKLGREQIMEALWPDLDLETTSSRLDRAVYSLRRVFEPARHRLATSPLLLTEREVVVLAEQTKIWVDADAFEQLLAQAHASQDPGEKEQLLQEASLLYTGHFISEEQALEVTIARRETLQRIWIGLLLDLADLRIARYALTEALEPLDRLLTADATNEAAVQRVISLFSQLGRRGEALRAYKRLATVLQQEYRINPLPETRALYDAVRLGADKNVAQLPVTNADVLDKQSTERNTIHATLQIGRNHQSSMVGREDEVGRLRNLLTGTEQVAKLRVASQKRPLFPGADPDRKAQSLILLGDVGIGKTRLAEEISREARQRGWAIAWSRVYAQESTIPYRLWTEILRKAMIQGAWHRQELQQRPLVFQSLRLLMPDLNVPQIMHQVSLPLEQEQVRLWEAVSELLSLISTSMPLLIVLDDLQWADASSCELLAYLARRIQGYPILIVGTCRENELSPQHPLRALLTDLQREYAMETISLLPLSNKQIADLVSQIPNISSPLVERIQERAGGNPFFAEELARTVSDQVVPLLELEQTDGALLPDTITAVLDLRLGRLSAACQRLLRKAAILGVSFQFETISEMEMVVPEMDEDQVLELIEEALHSGMITEEGTGTRITYHFWHSLLVDHLYTGLSAARRASLHRRAAEIFRELSRGHEEEQAATIVHHLSHGGGRPEQIVHYARLAGNRAYLLSSYPEAEKHYRLALDYLAKTAHQPDIGLEEKVALLELAGECTYIQGKLDGARDFYEQALALREQRLHTEEDTQEEAKIRALLLCEIGLIFHDSGDSQAAQEFYQKSEHVLENAGAQESPVWAYLRYCQSNLLGREGVYEEALQSAREAEVIFSKSLQEQAGKRGLLSKFQHILTGNVVNLGRTRMLLGVIESSQGHLKQASDYLQKALTIAEQCDDRREIAIVCCNLGDLRLRQGEHDHAKADLRRALSLVEIVGEKPLEGVLRANMGMLSLRLGDLQEAAQWFRQSVKMMDQSQQSMYMGLLRIYLANTLLFGGKWDEAEKTLVRALQILRTQNILPMIGLAFVVLGQMRLLRASLQFDNPILKERLLAKARRTLEKALALPQIDVETQIEGQLVLTTIQMMQHDPLAREQAELSLREAEQSEATWLIAKCQRVLGAVMIAQGEVGGEKYLDQAWKVFQKGEMDLEKARTLYHYGQLYLLQSRTHEKGIHSLQEAEAILGNKKAIPDLLLVQALLKQTAVREAEKRPGHI